MMERELISQPCNTVFGGCKASPSFSWAYTRAKCFKCGEHVCINCSQIISYLRYGRRRICGVCLEEMGRGI